MCHSVLWLSQVFSVWCLPLFPMTVNRDLSQTIQGFQMTHMSRILMLAEFYEYDEKYELCPTTERRTSSFFIHLQSVQKKKLFQLTIFSAHNNNLSRSILTYNQAGLMFLLFSNMHSRIPRSLYSSVFSDKRFPWSHTLNNDARVLLLYIDVWQITVSTWQILSRWSCRLAKIRQSVRSSLLVRVAAFHIFATNRHAQATPWHVELVGTLIQPYQRSMSLIRTP